jgi:N6-adenosine-specific RNA methylase IME4/ParB-like chromosome segregation protein Spo0J
VVTRKGADPARRADDGGARKDIGRGNVQPSKPTHDSVQAFGPGALAYHPLADLFPLIEGAEFDGLVADIKATGLLQPIALHEGKILDGRNRHRACLAAGVEPRFVEFEGNDPAAFVLSQNLARRHLGPSERAMVAARMANLKWGQRADRVEGSIDLSTAAQLAGVSEPSVKRAKVVLEHGTPELQQAVDHGRIAVHEAAMAARESTDAQHDFLAAAAAGRTFVVWRTDRGRKELAETLAKTSRALPVGEKRWPILLVDPPWQHDPGTHASKEIAANHYACMSLEEICALRIADLATDDAILFLWTTSPHLEKAFRVLAAWGFTYKTSLCWNKQVADYGYWLRGEHEILLLATRGSPPKPPYETVPGSMIRERKREHSRKPEASYALIERMYPGLPKLELFARSRRPGWDVWGNEAPQEEVAS